MNQLVAIYKLVLKHQVTRSRLILIGLATGLSGLLGFIIRNEPDANEGAVFFVSVLGLGLIIPVISLLFGSGAMGDWHTDETLVYVWLRPVSRLVIALGAIAAALTVAIPANLLPMVTAVLAAGQSGNGVLSGTVQATVLVTLAYTSVFALLGIVVRKPLAFGLIYIFIWEFFVARGAPGAARLSINSYGASVLARVSELSVPFDGRAEWATLAVPLGITVVAVLLAAIRLQRMDVA